MFLDLISGYSLHGDHAGLITVINLQHLTYNRHLSLKDVIRKEDSKGFVSDKVLGNQDGVPQPQRFLLPDIADLGQLGDAANLP